MEEREVWVEGFFSSVLCLDNDQPQLYGHLPNIVTLPAIHAMEKKTRFIRAGHLPVWLLVFTPVSRGQLTGPPRLQPSAHQTVMHFRTSINLFSTLSYKMLPNTSHPLTDAVMKQSGSMLCPISVECTHDQ